MSNPAQVGEDHSLAVLAWRAAHLGPEVARGDWETGVSDGWAGRYFNEDGTLRAAPL